MTVDETDVRILTAIEDGLPFVPAPFSRIARDLGMDEDEVLTRLRRLIGIGAVSRFGSVVRHHELGFTANAMCVWDLPNDRIFDIGEKMAGFPFVTLCYRRPRRPPLWPYNLFCMIHGRDRTQVRTQIARLIQELEIEDLPHAVLFSRRRFKQRGARYRPGSPTESAA